MWHQVASVFISILHVLFVLWMLLTPFFGGLDQLLLYCIIVPFLVAHWLLNNDQCALTLLEQWLRGVELHESFIHKIVSPVYLFMSGSAMSDATLKQWVYVITTCLWVYVLVKVWRALRV